MREHVVVATDGSPAGIGALRMALALAEREGRPLLVAALSRAAPAAALGSWLRGHEEKVVREQRERLSACIREQIWTSGSRATVCLVHVPAEEAAPAISTLVAETGSGLVLLPGGADRSGCWLGGESVLRVAGQVAVPVLSVPAGARGIPHRAVIAPECGACRGCETCGSAAAAVEASLHEILGGGEVLRDADSSAFDLLASARQRGADMLAVSCHCAGPLWLRSTSLVTTLVRSSELPVLFSWVAPARRREPTADRPVPSLAASPENFLISCE